MFNLREPSNRSAIVSRNVFCGANKPFLISRPNKTVNSQYSLELPRNLKGPFFKSLLFTITLTKFRKVEKFLSLHFRLLILDYFQELFFCNIFLDKSSLNAKKVVFTSTGHFAFRLENKDDLYSF